MKFIVQGMLKPILKRLYHVVSILYSNLMNQGSGSGPSGGGGGNVQPQSGGLMTQSLVLPAGGGSAAAASAGAAGGGGGDGGHLHGSSSMSHSEHPYMQTVRVES